SVLPRTIRVSPRRKPGHHSAGSETAEGERIGGLAANQIGRAAQDDSRGRTDVIPRRKRHVGKLPARGERLRRKTGQFSRVRQRRQRAGPVLGDHKSPAPGKREEGVMNSPSATAPGQKASG